MIVVNITKEQAKILADYLDTEIELLDGGGQEIAIIADRLRQAEEVNLPKEAANE